MMFLPLGSMRRSLGMGLRLLSYNKEAMSVSRSAGQWCSMMGQTLPSEAALVFRKLYVSIIFLGWF